jgi:Xaa-Pro aminopeptidase
VTSRGRRVVQRLDELGVAAFLVTTPLNVRYLVGFASSNAALLVTGERLTLFTDGRYIEAARRVDGLDVVLIDRGLAADLGERLAHHTDGPVAFEAARMTVADHRRVEASGLELVPTEREIEGLRAVKDMAELAAIRRSATLLSEGFEQFAAADLVGQSELAASRILDNTLAGLGADGLAFDTIVAAGPNAALPHHHPTDRVIEPDELLLVDAGCIVGDYASDCTRTFATGTLPARLEDAYVACLAIQTAALTEVMAGAEGKALDDQHRDRLRAAGYEPLHSLGHGVGLEVHESPRLARTVDDVLDVGAVVTVEPGVYLPGVGGIRIEDLVVVTEDGPEILTPVPKELRQVV